jgi:riboflavin synthase
MFTGIIQSIGRVASIEERAGDVRLCIEAPGIDPVRMGLGDSVAVAGVCLTVAEIVAGGFVADVSRETLALTTVSDWLRGQGVNLEPALRAGDALGGHLVSGHVDGRAQLVASDGDARSQRLRWWGPPALMRFIAAKGSVTLDGVSLTVNSVSAEEFAVNLIPHTLQVTTLGALTIGAKVNLEIDLIARYTARLLESGPGGIY